MFLNHYSGVDREVDGGGGGRWRADDLLSFRSYYNYIIYIPLNSIFLSLFYFDASYVEDSKLTSEVQKFVAFRFLATAESF